LFIVHADETRLEASSELIGLLTSWARGRVWLAAAPTYQGRDRMRLNLLADLARRHRIQLIASNDVLYHDPGRRVLQDVVTCIREHMTLWEAGRRLEANAERHLKAAGEMGRLFREHAEAIAETQRFIARIGFTLD